SFSKPTWEVHFFFLFPIRMKYVALITGVIAILYAVFSAPFVLSAAGHVGGLLTAGLILLSTGGEPSRLNRPIEHLFKSWRRVKQTSPKENAFTGSGENLETQIDVILDKISRGGMKSLSNAEKQFLRAASERMNRSKN
ncbi:MAG TPA: hypothetical protein PLY93_04270, partial [Turneriella sp.]|nr:hypothetical protein [Turneriella sp.]